MTVLVTGGAGYIGSHMVLELIRKDYDVVIIDSLEKGHEESIKKSKLYVGNLRDGKLLDKVFTENKIDGVIHFAAYSLVGESVKNPSIYYENNIESTRVLLDAMIRHDCFKIVFSSSAAVYGSPTTDLIGEDELTNPTNTYGETKLVMEKMMKRYEIAYGLKYVALRYFNAAGADLSGEIGEVHNPESHLIPLVLDVALGKREKINIFGGDYETKDGTCIRDYIHVTDLCSAHLLALQYLNNHRESNVFNLGNGVGYSVLEVVDMVERVTNIPIEREIVEKRDGDPPVLVASSQKAKEILGWCPKYNELEKIIETAWSFKKNYPNGYKEK
ncbi:MAG: UDP-glucose 4-epimerase GalE [bacterium]|nr:UDP-glucose 4-epimerase GalE [bacterium]